MKKFAVLFCVATASLFLTGCDDAPADTREADAKAIKEIETQWNHDYAQKDADKAIAHYAADAVLMNPGMPASSGKEAITKTVKEMVADPALELKFKASKVEVAKSGDVAYTQGSYTMTATGPNKKVMNDHGSYVTVYRKEKEGGWKAVSDIATSDIPPAAAVPEPIKKAVKAAKKARRR